VRVFPVFNLNRYAKKLRRRFASELIAPARLTHSYVRENVTRLGGIKAVMWDVYGTLVKAESGDLDSYIKKKAKAVAALAAAVKEFGFDAAFSKSQVSPERWLLKQYLGEIEQVHRTKRRRGVPFPEVKIEYIWLKIIKSLVRRGYKPDYARFGTLENLALAVGYYFDLVISKTAFYRGAARVVSDLHRRGIIQGFISNAQFYTPVNLDLMLREELGKDYRGFDKIFHPRLRIFSYQVGSSKPGKPIFEKAVQALTEMGISPDQCLYVGNDMYKDIWGAWRYGFKTLFAAHDQNACKSRIDKTQCHKLVPDATVKNIRHIVDVVAAPEEKALMPPLNLGFAHYHLYPSGVKTVMINNTLALASRKKFENIFISIFASIEENISRAGLFSIKDMLLNPVDNLHIRNIDVDGLRYSDKTFRSREEFINAARETKRAIVRNIDLSRATPDNPYVLHVHNFSLAKNPTTPMALALIARWALQHKKPLLILNQIHDFVENNRFELMKHVLNCTGKYDPEFAASFLYADLPNIFYAVLNSEDLDNLISIGIDPEHALLLPNSVGNVRGSRINSENRAYIEQLKTVITRTARKSGFFFEPERKIILQPVKPIARKNIAESVLLISMLNSLEPGYQLLVTLTPNSPSDIRYSETIKRFVQQHRLPVYIGLDHREVISRLDRQYRPSDSSMLGISDVFNIAAAVISTSIIEGFGLPFIEGWLFGKYVLGRRVKSVIEDFEQNGLDFSSLYQRFAIDFNWLDISIDQLVNQYQRKINRNRHLISLPPINKSKIKREILLKKIFSNNGSTFIDFADLGLQTQLELIRKIINDPRMMRDLIATNPFIERFADILRHPPSHTIEHNRTTIINRYGLAAQAHRLIRAFKQIRDCYRDEQLQPPHKHWINNRYIIEKYLSVENTRLLL